MKEEHNHNRVFWMMVLLISLAVLINTGKCRAQASFDLNGGWYQDELVFSAGLTGHLPYFAARGSYFYSNNNEVFSVSIGPSAKIAHTIDLMLLFGTEINNDFNGKISLLTRFPVANGASIQLGAESVADHIYASLGLSVMLDNIDWGKPKPKRFY